MLLSVWLRCYSSVQESFKNLAVKGIYLTTWKLLETWLAGSFTNRWVHGHLQNQSTREMFQTSKQKLRDYVTKQQLHVFILLCIPYLCMGFHSVMFCSVFCQRGGSSRLGRMRWPRMRMGVSWGAGNANCGCLACQNPIPLWDGAPCWGAFLLGDKTQYDFAKGVNWALKLLTYK